MRLIICSTLLLTACATHEVRCDGRLEPINQAAPHAQSAPSAASPLRPETSGRGNP